MLLRIKNQIFIQLVLVPFTSGVRDGGVHRRYLLQDTQCKVAFMASQSEFLFNTPTRKLNPARS